MLDRLKIETKMTKNIFLLIHKYILHLFSLLGTKCFFLYIILISGKKIGPSTI